MDVPTSESVASVVAAPSTNGQGIYLAADLRQGGINGDSMFFQSPNRTNSDILNPVETSLGKLVGYNNQQPYNGYFNWSNNVTGRGVRSTATQQVSMRDLSNYTVSTTTKETIGLSGISTVHSASSSTVRGYFNTLPIGSWNSSSAGFGTGSAGLFGVIAYKNNVNRPRLATIEQNLYPEGNNYVSNVLYGIPTSTGSNGGDLNFNAVFNFSTVGLGNTAESVIATIPNIIYSYGTSSNAPLDPIRSYSYKRQGLLIYSNLGGDSGKLYYNRYLVSQSNDSGLGMAIELGATTKLPNNDINNCVLGLVQEVNQYGTGTAGGNFSIPFDFVADTRGYTDISSATLLYTNGGGWYARIISVTGSTLYTGSAFFLGGANYPQCWRNENGAQMKQYYSIVGSYDGPNGNTTDPEARIILSYQTPEYGVGGGGTVNTSSWNANPSNPEWYRFSTSSVQVDTTIITGAKKWRSKAIEFLGGMTISGSTNSGDVVCIAMAHTGSSIDVALYMNTGSSFVQLDYLAGIGGGTVDSTDRITLQNFNYTPNPVNSGIGYTSQTDYNVYNSNNTSSISSSNYIALTYSTNAVDPATKVVYIRVDTNRIQFVNTSSIPTDTYGPYPQIPSGNDYFFNHFPIYQSYTQPSGYISPIGWDDPSVGFVSATSQGNNKKIYTTIGSYYDSSAGTSEIGISSIGLY